MINGVASDSIKSLRYGISKSELVVWAPDIGYDIFGVG